MRRHIRGIACGNPATPQSGCFDRSSRRQIRQQGRQDNPQKPNTIFYETSNPRPPNGQRHHSRIALEAAAAGLFRLSENHPRKGIKQSCQVRFFGREENEWPYPQFRYAEGRRSVTQLCAARPLCA